MQRGLLVKFSCNSPIRYLIAHWRALLVVRSFVLEWRVVATTNMSWVVRYREQVKGQKVEEIKPVEINEVEEWEIEKILNKRKIKKVVKYLVW